MPACCQFIRKMVCYPVSEAQVSCDTKAFSNYWFVVFGLFTRLSLKYTFICPINIDNGIIFTLKYFRWLYNVDTSEPHISQSTRLETGRLRGWLARRRWVTSCAAVRGVIRISRRQEVPARGGRKSYLHLLSVGSREFGLGDHGLWDLGLQGQGRWKIAYFQ